MSEHQRTLIGYRMERARSTLQDALLLRAQGGSIWSVVNRAYYGMFYATLALLLHIGQSSSRHSGVIRLFDQHYIRTGKLPAEMSRWLHRAFELRQMGDYHETAELEEEQVQLLLQQAEQFIRLADEYLSAQEQSRE
ncbi:MAG: HEPN domain-containing protein [Armatimonadota bacterium]|nr:HEPN domain-containing protein [Armatimonadota bacterium]